MQALPPLDGGPALYCEQNKGTRVSALMPLWLFLSLPYSPFFSKSLGI